MASAQIPPLEREPLEREPVARHAYPRSEPVEDRWLLHGRIPLRMRAAGRRDAAAMQELVRGLSPQSRYRRFFNPLRELPPDLLASFTRHDPAGKMTLLVLAQQDGRQVPVAMGQCVAADYPARAEFALVVADAWQGHGIGARLLHNLMLLASAAGIEAIEGDVLDENEPMRQLLKRRDFEFLPHPDGAYLFRARKQLEPAAWKCPQLAAAMQRARLAR